MRKLIKEDLIIYENETEVEYVGKGKYDLCSICELKKKMSEDHIPPKCCGNNGKVFYRRFTPEYIGFQTKPIKDLYSQNGIKFRYICSECNNLLGTKYDDELGKFKEVILKILNGSNKQYNIDVNKIVKSVVGDFLASSERDNCTHSVAMRDYFFDKNVDAFFKDYSLFVYFYPYKDQVFIMKEYMVLDFKDNKFSDKLLSSLYFYPFAFIFSEKRADSNGTDLLEFFNDRSELRISTNDWYYDDGRMKEYSWPVVVTGYNAVLVGSATKDSVFDVKIKNN